MIVSIAEDGSLLVQAAHAAAGKLRRLGATLDPSGLWRVQKSRADALRRAIAPKPAERAPAPSRIISGPPRPGPTSAEFAAWVDGLPIHEDLAITRPARLLVGFRLRRPCPGALAAIKAMPGRVWVAPRRSWEILISTHEKMTAVEKFAGEAVDALSIAPPREGRHEIAAIYAIEDAPNLNEVVESDGRSVVFEASSKLFRLHEGHARRYPHLANRIGSYATVLYGRSAGEEERP